MGKNTKITFSDGNYCYVDCDWKDYTIELDSITEFFNKDGEKIENFRGRDIDWENEEVSIEFRVRSIRHVEKKYDGKINRNGKLKEGKLIDYVEGTQAIDSIMEGTFGENNELNGWGKKSIYAGIDEKQSDLYRIEEGNFDKGKLKGKGKISYYDTRLDMVDDRGLYKVIEGVFDEEQLNGPAKITYYDRKVGKPKKVKEGAYKGDYHLDGQETIICYYEESEKPKEVIKHTYKDGKLNGQATEISYYDDGSIWTSKESNYKDDKLNGEYKMIYYYYSDLMESHVKNLIFEGTFDGNDVLRGTRTTYHNDSEKICEIEEGTFIGYELDGLGKITYYNKDEEIIEKKEGFFREGVFIGDTKTIESFDKSSPDHFRRILKNQREKEKEATIEKPL